MRVRIMDIRGMEGELRQYEARHRLPSADFRRLFGQGEYPHTLESVEWAELYDEFMRLPCHYPSCVERTESRLGCSGSALRLAVGSYPNAQLALAG